MSDTVNCSAVYPTLAVHDVATTCAWYIENLGFTMRFVLGEPAMHGAIMFGQACVHFWHGTPQDSENWLYFDIDNLEAMHQRALANDVQIVDPPQDYPWGMREFSAIDLNGYKIKFGQQI